MDASSQELGRQMPFSADAERYVLGAILSGVKDAGTCFDVLRAEDFMLEPHRKIYAAASTLREEGKQPDLLGVHDRLLSLGEVEAVGGIAYVASLSDGLPKIAPVSQWAALVREKAQLRAGIRLTANLQDRFYGQQEAAANLLDGAIESLSQLAREIDDDADDGMTYREAGYKLLEEISSGVDAKIFTGIDKLDKNTGGFKAGELVVITAETGVGKTVLAQQTRLQACRNGHHSLFASGEMLAPHLLRRILAADADVHPSQMRRREWLDDADVLALTNAANHQCDRCRIIDGDLDLVRIRRDARRMKGRSGLDLIVLDYDELITAPGKDEFDQQKNLTRAAKSMAMELSCAVILVSQLRKPLAGEDAQKPTLQRLYGSGAKAKHASIVLLADREFVRELDGDETSAQIFVLKNRDGKLGRVTCQFNIQTLRFESVDPDPMRIWDTKARAAGDGDGQ